MKPKHSVPALLLVCLFALPAQAAGSLAGNWAAPFGEGGNKIACNFALKGNALSGACQMPGPGGVGAVHQLSGSVSGKNVTWTWPIDTGKGIFTVQFQGQWDLKNALTVQRTYKNVPAGMVVNPPSGTNFIFARAAK